MKKLEFPLAKIRDDGTPAVWLTFGNWMLIEFGLVRSYLESRERIGAYKARQALKKPDSLDAIAGKYFDESHAHDSIRLYRVGWEAHKKVYERGDYQRMHHTPEQLIDAGDRAEKKAFDEQTKQLQPAEAP